MKHGSGWLAVAAACVSFGAHAQNYPVKFVKFVVTYPAGGSSDAMARIIGAPLGDMWGQQVIVDSRPGAAGAIGMEYAAKQPADGYTFLLGNFGPVVANPLLQKVNYNVQKEFVPVCQITSAANILVVPIAMPVKSVKQLVALAKARPNQITFGSAGTGGTLHFGLEMLMREASVKITHVPFKGAGPAVTDLIGGQINGMFVDLPVISPYVKSGRVRALAVTSRERSQYFPEIPTTKEAGYPGVEMTNCYGLLVPAKTPRDIVAKLHDAIVKTVATQSVRENLMRVGADPQTMSPEEFARFIKGDIEKWGKLAKSAGIVIER